MVRLLQFWPVLRIKFGLTNYEELPLALYSIDMYNVSTVNGAATPYT